MRIRTIKPEWLDDEGISLASSDARTMSIALIIMADDEGRGRANPTMLAGRVFPGVANPRETSAKALDDLAKLRYVILYESDGQQYYAIRNWKKHQKVDKPRKSQLPPPPSDNHSESNDSSLPREDSRQGDDASRTFVRGPGPGPGPLPGPDPTVGGVDPSVVLQKHKEGWVGKYRRTYTERGGLTVAERIAALAESEQDFLSTLKAFWEDVRCGLGNHPHSLLALEENFRRLAIHGPADEYKKPIRAGQAAAKASPELEARNAARQRLNRARQEDTAPETLSELQRALDEAEDALATSRRMGVSA